jgi:hypothetical protein
MRKCGANADQLPRTFGVNLVPSNFVMRPVRKIEEFCSLTSNNEDVFQRHGTTRSDDNLQHAEAAGPAHLFLVSRNILTS